MRTSTLALFPLLLLTVPSFAQDVDPPAQEDPKPTEAPKTADPEDVKPPVPPPVGRLEIPDFTSLDTNQDAALSITEAALNPVMNEGFVDADANKNLQVSFQEFNAWIRTIRD